MRRERDGSEELWGGEGTAGKTVSSGPAEPVALCPPVLSPGCQGSSLISLGCPSYSRSARVIEETFVLKGCVPGPRLKLYFLLHPPALSGFFQETRPSVFSTLTCYL